MIKVALVLVAIMATVNAGDFRDAFKFLFTGSVPAGGGAKKAGKAAPIEVQSASPDAASTQRPSGDVNDPKTNSEQTTGIAGGNVIGGQVVHFNGNEMLGPQPGPAVTVGI